MTTTPFAVVGPEDVSSCSRQLDRMMGLAPQVRQSGPTRREGGLLRSGSGGACARRWSRLLAVGRRRPDGRRALPRLVANTGSGKKAIEAMARRLGVLLRRLSALRALSPGGLSPVRAAFRPDEGAPAGGTRGVTRIREGQTAKARERATARAIRWQRPLAIASIPYLVPRACQADGSSATSPPGVTAP
jgi:hypothetical protein